VFRQIVDVNLIGVWNTVMAAAPSMQAAATGGAIVLVSSTQGLKGTGGTVPLRIAPTARPNMVSSA
jgi:NAD(P)-dependent dehydrogenase (short-subunit alcohol dehydrogenase family)